MAYGRGLRPVPSFCSQIGSDSMAIYDVEVQPLIHHWVPNQEFNFDHDARQAADIAKQGKSLSKQSCVSFFNLKKKGKGMNFS